ncbi:MAG: amidase [Chloroflexi bacterium]|nr:amidase [Chloroflexota bacterium]
MTELHELSVAEAAREIREGRVSPVALMEALLSRAETMEPALKVWVTLDPEAALEQARESERTLGRNGDTGPLHGVPIGVKDIFFTEGIRTTACSPIYADFVPGHDSTTVARLKQAGAVVMGKTVTTEWACMDPSPTRNPWNAEHTPGGSSSGSAVGVAARVFPAALGSQTAGSVLRPAAYNGVVGIKPTFGLISRHGVFPVASSLDTIGFFTRTVEDAALMLNVLAGHDPSDDSSSKTETHDYRAALTDDAQPPRIGVVGQLFHDRALDEIRLHTEQIIALLAERGASVDKVTLATDFDALLSAHRTVMNVELADVREADFGARPDDFGPKVRGLIEAGIGASGVAYVQAQRVRAEFRRAVEEAMEGFDVLLTPATPTPAPRDLTTTGDPMFQTPWTTAGVPAITLPSGLSESGLPLGIQLAAAPFAERTLLASARWCEEVLDVSLTPPIAS